MRTLWIAIGTFIILVLGSCGALAGWSLDHFQSKSEAQSMSADIREIRSDVKELLRRN